MNYLVGYLLREGDLDLCINLLPDADILGDLVLALGLDDAKNVVGPAASVNDVVCVPGGAKVNLGVGIGVAPPLLDFVFLIFLV